ncbi:hypothetical protein [uncultured Parabacteroides sp.]|uniref:hypothetical protein n=1 Tax=uncultured Parabacteroides sp. TaxID=512312 RepID=UPI0026EBA449|nr:hypothetical protein [uncultured Parabacteroides sp.]
MQYRIALQYSFGAQSPTTNPMLCAAGLQLQDTIRIAPADQYSAGGIGMPMRMRRQQKLLSSYALEHPSELRA